MDVSPELVSHTLDPLIDRFSNLPFAYHNIVKYTLLGTTGEFKVYSAITSVNYLFVHVY